MKISFTGTQEGLTLEQKNKLETLLKELAKDYDSFIHGDCIGADEEAHYLANKLGYEIFIRPCFIKEKRAYCQAKHIFDVKHPLERNRDIVDDGSILVACPKGDKEELRSGTWATVRHARKIKKTIVIIYPNGSHIVERQR